MICKKQVQKPVNIRSYNTVAKAFKPSVLFFVSFHKTHRKYAEQRQLQQRFVRKRVFQKNLEHRKNRQTQNEFFTHGVGMCRQNFRQKKQPP